MNIRTLLYILCLVLPLAVAGGSAPDPYPPTPYVAPLATRSYSNGGPALLYASYPAAGLPGTASRTLLQKELGAWMNRDPHPVKEFFAPFYYKNRRMHMEAKATIAGDATAAYGLALAAGLEPDPGRAKILEDKSKSFLNAWSKYNQWVHQEEDSELILVYKGINFLLAAYYYRLPWDDAPFRSWVGRIFLPAAERLTHRLNNQASWGFLGAIVSRHYLGRHQEAYRDIQRLKGHIRWSVAGTWNPLARPGELWTENLRHNSGMWYTYFSLNPLTKAAWFIRRQYGVDLFPMLEKPLASYFQYCRDPEAWPYRRQKGGAGRIQQVLFPGEGRFLAHRAYNLFEAMGHIYGNKDWSDFAASKRPVSAGNVWKYPTLFIDYGLI